MTRVETSIQTVPALAAGENVDTAHDSDGTFLRRPFVQNVLPFLTSLSVHAGVVGLGLLAFTAITIVRHPPLMQEQTSAPTTDYPTQSGPPQFIGDSIRLNVPMMQDQVPSQTMGNSFTKAPTLNAAVGGAPGEDPGNVFAVGAHAAMSSGFAGTGGQTGDGVGDGVPAMFGHPQHGGHIRDAMFTSPRGARRIAFVCDASGSMINKMASLKAELQSAVTHLKPIQEFSIIFFQDNKHPDMLSNSLLPATPETKRKAGTFLEGVTATGMTEPIPGIEAAFRQQPELIYLLTDGDFPDNAAVLGRIRDLNKEHKVKINTIAFVSASDTDTAFIDLLKTIASENGGTYKHVDEGSLGN